MIFFWRYELKPRRRLSAIASDAPRQGALIRSGDGFADIHPWPELGDVPLDGQLSLLARGETTALTRASLRFAAIDGEARQRHASLFDGLVVPESHWLWTEGDVPSEFDTVKIKMSPGMRVDPILTRYRLRLDYNATLGPRELLEQQLPAESVEFVEDPTAYDRDTWRTLRRAGFRLALDRPDADEAEADVFIVKPAVQELPNTATEIVVTSYMDHPVGQLGAAYIAARNATSKRCGLLTHLLYENDPFIERIQVDGCRLVPQDGTGIGFDDLLASLSWKALG